MVWLPKEGVVLGSSGVAEAGSDGAPLTDPEAPFTARTRNEYWVPLLRVVTL